MKPIFSTLLLVLLATGYCLDPILVGQYTAQNAQFLTFTLSQDSTKAYIINNATTNTLWIFDVSNRESPTALGSFSDATFVQTYGRPAMLVTNNSNYLMIANYAGSLAIFNVENTASPSRIYTKAGPWVDAALSYNQEILYALGPNEIYFFNVTNPAKPVGLNQYFNSSSTFDNLELSADQTLAYVSGQVGTTPSLILVQIENPQNPEWVANVETNLPLTNITMSTLSDTIYLSNYGSGNGMIIEAFSNTEENNPKYNTEFPAHSPCINAQMIWASSKNPYLYVGCVNGFEVINVETLSNTYVMGSATPGPSILAVPSNEEFIFVITPSAGQSQLLIYATTCKNNEECPNNTPICYQGACVQCETNNNCESAADAACISNTCSPCAENSECQHLKNTEYCQNGTCFQCLQNTECLPYLCLGGQCEHCKTSSQCPTTTPNCFNNGECIACTSNTECANNTEGTPICNNGECVECNQNEECTGGLVCLNHACTNCTNSTQCPGSLPFCFDGVCTQCGNNEECPSKTPICSLNHECQACENNEQCESYNVSTPNCANGGCVARCTGGCNSEAPICSNGLCTGCSFNSQCETQKQGEVCNNEEMCVACFQNEDCQGEQKCCSGKCVATNNECNQCASNANCAPETPICINGACTGCQNNQECPGWAPICQNGTCLECQNNGECPKANPNCLKNYCFACSNNNNEECSYLNCEGGFSSKCYNNGSCICTSNTCKNNAECDYLKCGNSEVPTCQSEGNCVCAYPPCQNNEECNYLNCTNGESPNCESGSCQCSSGSSSAWIIWVSVIVVVVIAVLVIYTKCIKKPQQDSLHSSEYHRVNEETR